MKSTPYSGADMKRESGGWSQPAEEVLRRVCREQRERIQQLEAQVEEMEIELGRRARVRQMVRKQAV